MTDVAQVNCEYLPLPDNSIDLIFTDPPYVKDLIHTYKWLALEASRVLKPGAFVLAMCGGNQMNRVMQWFNESGLTFFWLYNLGLKSASAGIVWKHLDGKTLPISTRTKSILAFSKGVSLPRTATVGLYWAGGADKRWHHWGQDVDSHRYYIDCFSRHGDLVCDPFTGGGTTAYACELLERRHVSFDIDPDACLTTKHRLESESANYYPLFDNLPIFSGVS